jgi:hypothetical protein
MTLPNPFDFLNGQSGGGETTAVADPPPVAAVAPAETTVPATPPKTTRTTKAARKPLYIDLETIPDESRLHLFDLPPIPTPAVYAEENEGPAPSELIKETIEDVKAVIAKAQANGKKLPRVILEAAIAVEQKRPKVRKGVVDLFSDMIAAIDGEAAHIQQAVDEQRKTCSVTPEFCRIVALGWAVGDDPACSMVVGQPSLDGKSQNTEKTILEKAWSLISLHGPIVGFNVIGFDLHVIFNRSMILDVDSTKVIDRKSWGPDVVDLMEARFGYRGAMGLKKLAKLLGIPVPAEGVDGSQVAELFVTNPEKLAEYVRSDICVTRALHRKYSGHYVK